MRATDYLSALDQVNALALARGAIGLDQFTSSALREINALKAYGGIASLCQNDENIFGTREYTMREARKFASAISVTEQNRKRHTSLIGEPLGYIDRYRRMVSDSLGPLSAWRSAALYESEASRIANQNAGFLSSAVKASYLDTFSAAEQFRRQREMLVTNFGEPQADRWITSTRELAGQFASARGMIERQTRVFRDNTVFDLAYLARGLGMPVMDKASFAVIARSSGVEGVLAQLKSLGVDQETLRRVAATVNDEDADALDLLGEERSHEATTGQPLTKAQLARLWNLFLLLYALLMPLYGLWDSSQAEARLTAEMKLSEARTEVKIKESEERTSAKIDALNKLMERVLDIAEQEVRSEVSMVVRERVVVIRSEPQHGAGVVAEAFPNQVVTLIEERGKWIKVEYYDWIMRGERTGWALKKYFVRVESSGARRPQQALSSVD